MDINNGFLVNVVAHDDIIGNCSCINCRQRRLDRLNGVNIESLRNSFQDLLPLTEDIKLDNYHSQVIAQIVFGEKYKQAASNGSPYTYFKSWAKRQFPNLSVKELSKFCNRVNEASSVFHNWDTIVTNLTDARLKFDARRFSVAMFHQAKRIEWCLSYNDQIRKKGKMSLDEPLYPKDKFDAIFQNIIDSNILDDVDFDTNIAAYIGGRLQTKMITYCRYR